MSRTLTCLLLLLSLAIWGCSARSYSIEEGLAEIAQAYPALTFSPATFPIRLPWTDTVAQACEADPLSAPTNGIVCLASSSIAGLVIDETWSKPIPSPSFQSMQTLAETLYSLEVTVDTDAHDRLILGMMQASATSRLETVRLDRTTPEILQAVLSATYAKGSLSSLTATCPDCTSISLAGIDWNKASSLRSKSSTAPVAELGSVDVLAELPVLKVLHLHANSSTLIPKSSTVQYLSLTNINFTTTADWSDWNAVTNFTWIQCRGNDLKLPLGVRYAYMDFADDQNVGSVAYSTLSTVFLRMKSLAIASAFFSAPLSNITLVNTKHNLGDIVLQPSPGVEFLTVIDCVLQSDFISHLTGLQELTMIRTTDLNALSIWKTLRLVHFEGVDISGVDRSAIEFELAYSITLVSCGLQTVPSFQSGAILLFLNLSSNSIANSIIDLQAFPSLVSVDLSVNLFSTSFPALPSVLPNLKYLNLANNSFTGSIASNSLEFNLLTLDARNNRLTALSLPDTDSPLIELYLDGNPWSNFPTTDQLTRFPELQTFTISNCYESTFRAPAFWATHRSLFRYEASNNPGLAEMPAVITAPKLRIIDVHGSSFGAAPLPIFDLTSTTRFIRANFARTGLTGTIPSSYTGWSFNTLDLSGNLLYGCFNSFIWSSGSRVAMTDMLLASNDFGGAFPSLTNFQSLSSFNAMDNRFDSCASAPFAAGSLPSLIACNVTYQRFSRACDCPQLYAGSICQPPICEGIRAAPLGYLPCSNETSLITPPSVVPSPCRGSSPGPAFNCNPATGTWQTNGSVITPTITIPPATAVEVDGDLNVTSLTFGSGATIQVNGCVYLGLSIFLELTEEDLKALSKKTTIILLTANLSNQTCSGDTDLSTVNLQLKTPNLKCKKLKTENPSQRTTLAVTLTLDSSGCNVWWIILVSVVGAVLLILIVFVLIVTFIPAATAAVRPFWVRSQKREAAQPGAVS